MATIRADFLNKNMYRKYPIKDVSTHVFQDGTILPQTWFTSAQITSVFSHHSISISKVYFKNGYLNVTLSDKTTGQPLGFFGGIINNDFQIFDLQPLIPEIAGSLTIGTKEAFTLEGTYFLSLEDGALEDSTIYCFVPPAVKAIRHDEISAVGQVVLKGNNVSVTEQNNDVTLGVIDVSTIASNNDLSSVYQNCPTPFITQINTVFPNDNGNIDIYTIVPMTLSIVSGAETVIGIDTPTLSLQEICPETNLVIPPVNNSNLYYSNIITNNVPEWKTWINFTN